MRTGWLRARDANDVARLALALAVVVAAATISHMAMTVIAIHIGQEEGGGLAAVSSVRARAGQGLEGDRYFHASGAPAGGALTLVEDEVVESIGLPPGATRRPTESSPWATS